MLLIVLLSDLMHTIVKTHSKLIYKLHFYKYEYISESPLCLVCTLDQLGQDSAADFGVFTRAARCCYLICKIERRDTKTR